MFSRISFFGLIGLWLGVFSCMEAKAQEKAVKPPNIVLIYADDLGFSDLNCYGKDYGANFIETPHTDKLAAESVKFTNAYAAAPLCSPSRAALLTGKSPARLNFEFVTKYPQDQYIWDDSSWTGKFKDRVLIPPPFTLNLPLEELTVAEMLKTAGYTTALVGKWHVASHHQVYNGWNPEFGPKKQGFDWAEDAIGAWGNVNAYGKVRDGEYPPDELTNRAVSYLQQKHEKPFFLFVSHYYVHTPLDTTLQWLIKKYETKAKKLGQEYSVKRIRYAAFVEAFDHYVGELLKAVDDNTVVIFTSDNGGMPEFSFNRPLRGSKWNLYEGGVRIPMLVKYPGANAGNSICSVPVIQTDFWPTFYELATGKKHSGAGLDGTSVLPLFKGLEAPQLLERSLFWHFPYYHPEGSTKSGEKTLIGVEDGYISVTNPQSAIRKGKYKLLYFYEDKRVELYDLNNDLQEKNDLSRTFPEIAGRLKEELMDYLTMVKARLPREK